MRVLFSCRAVHGHVYPVMPLALALRRAGHDVAFATERSFHPALERLGFPCHSGGPSIAWAEEEVRRAVGEHRRMAVLSEDERLHFAARIFGELLPRRVLADLVPLLHEQRPDLLVYEAYDFGAGLAAATTRLPAVRHGLGPYDLPPPLPAMVREQLDAVAREHGGAVRELDPFVADGLLDLCPPALRPGAEPAPAGSLPLRPVPWNEPGARVPPSFREPTTRPRAYVTLGTIVFGAVEVMRAAVDGLAELGALMVVAVGPEGDPAALGSLPAGAQAERFVDQAALLPHLDVVVSHCGSGTMLGALTYGVPQLALPQGADQFRNGDGVVDAGIGLRLLPHEITPAAVAGAVHDLLDDPRYRAAANRLRDEIAAMPSPEAVVPTLAELASGR